MEINPCFVVLIFFVFLIPVTDSACSLLQCDNDKNVSDCSLLYIARDGYILSVSVYNESSKNMCKINDSFRFANKIIRVKNECKGTFNVCFVDFEWSTLNTTVFQNTSVSITKHKDQQSNAASGIAGGIVAAIIVLIILLIAFLVVKRRNIQFFKKKTKQQQQQQNDRNYMGNQNVAFVLPSEDAIHNHIAKYSELDSKRYQHYYIGISDSLNVSTENEPHSYVTIYDSLEGRYLPCTSDTNAVATIKEPGDNTSPGTNQEEKHYDYAVFPAKLDFENPTGNTSMVNEYAILDPSVTGFHRLVIKNREDVEIYELAKPASNGSEVDDFCEDDDRQYMPATDNVYDNAHNNRHQHASSKIYNSRSNDENYYENHEFKTSVL